MGAMATQHAHRRQVLPYFFCPFRHWLLHYFGKCNTAQCQRHAHLYRRMTVLAVIGLLHMMLLWSGDILFLYAFIHTGDYHCDNIVYSVLYVISVYPTGLMYITGLALLYRCFPHGRLWTALAYPGRMALTNYLSQSVCGILLFYGIGMGMGADIGLWPTEVLAIIVFLFQICFSALWLKLFQFGPLEWIWRMFTYGKTFPLKKH